jgi:hypothetical protein
VLSQDVRDLESQDARAPGGDARPLRRRRGSLVRRALLAADVFGLVSAALLVELLYHSRGSGDQVSPGVELVLFALTLPGWVIAAKLLMLYDRDDERTDHSTVDDLLGVFLLVTVGAWLLFAGATITHTADPGLTKLVTFWLLAIGLVTLARVIARTAIRRSTSYVQNVLIVGAGEVGQLVARKLLQHHEYAVSLIGFVDADPRALNPGVAGVPVLGDLDDLERVVSEHEIERVLVAFTHEPHEVMLNAVARLRSIDVQVDIVPRLFEALGPHVKLHSVEGMPLIALPTTKRFPFSPAIKRGVDIVLASIGLLCIAPLVPYFAWRIKRESPGPVLSASRGSVAICRSSPSSSSGRCGPTPTRPLTASSSPPAWIPRQRPRRTVCSSSTRAVRSRRSARGCGRPAWTSCLSC